MKTPASQHSLEQEAMPARGEARGEGSRFARCERPICWIALSALHGSSSVMWTRLRWLVQRLWFRSAWSEIPLEAASEMMATRSGWDPPSVPTRDD